MIILLHLAVLFQVHLLGKTDLKEFIHEISRYFFVDCTVINHLASLVKNHLLESRE